VSDKFPGNFVTTGAPAGFSVAFDGSTGYLTATTSTAFSLPADFTVEAWVYPTATGTTNGPMIIGSTTTNALKFFQNSSAYTVAVALYGSSSFLSSTNAMNANAWNHVAVTRSGSTVTLWVNGVSSGTATQAAAFASTQVLIGGGQTSAYLSGYISNARVVKGTAVYTAAFTPPTQLFPITNTTLLTCQSTTIVDNSTSALTLTASGSATVSNFTPFAGYTGFNPALGAAAGGVWTLDQAEYYQANRKWPIYDPYFNQTTLMLHGNGTNGAQNNTFLDSSTNNFTITRNGNTTQGTFTPFSQTGWSNYFVNTSYLGLPVGSSTVGASDFSLEAWIYPLDRSNAYYIFGGQSDRATTSGSSYNFNMPSSTGYLSCELYVGGSNYNFASTTAPALNTWSHVALVRTGGTVSLFINGVIVATNSTLGTSTINTGSTTYTPAIGANGSASSTTFSGYISNFRLIIGSGGYNATQNFTPPTSPLTATTNTRILSCQSNRFVDNSATNNTLTPANSPSVQAFSPFVPAYITPTTYSNWFNGSTGYLYVLNNTAITLSGDFTIEFWVNLNSVSASQPFTSYGTTGSASNLLFLFNNSVGLRWYYSGGTVDINQGSTSGWSANTWYHVAAVRSGTTITLYRNGVSLASGTSSQTYQTASQINIGGSPGDSVYLNGCISNYRVLKGTALYTSAFTPPTAPLTAITNTSLLICQSSTIVDNSGNAFTVTVSGTVYPVTSPTPFPAVVDQTTLNTAYSTSLIGGSAYFDGNGDNLTAPQGAAFQFSGDFTIECWVYANNSTGGASYDGVFDTRSGNVVSSNSAGVNYTPSGYLNMYVGGANTASSTLLGAKQWVHVALVRSGSAVTMYQNGVSVATATTSTNLSDGYFTVGGFVSSGYWNGYISNVRVVKGTAVYTKAFAPPLVPLTAISNTQLLLSTTNAGIYDNTANNALETVGSAQISTAQSKFGGSSMYMPATNGNYFNGKTNPINLFFGTGNFTIECWVYPTAFTNSAAGILGVGTSGGYIDYVLEVGTSGAVSYIDANASRFTSSSNLSTNTWTHVCLARTSSAVTLYFNGVSVGTVSTISNISGTSTSSLYVGTGPQVPGSRQFIGYIDDLRITKGVARYTTNFTPPTSQLQDQ